MTTKPPSRLAASGSADDPSEQVTKEHNDDDDESGITVDPSEDVTVEATEDVTSESSHTPQPSFRPGTVGVSPGQRAPTLLGVPIQSLPLPGVTSSANGDATRTIDYNEEITVLAQPAPADPLAALDEALDDRPSITDDDEEETKVEPAETAMKAAASIDDVSTALSAQANLEREKALRRSVPAPSVNDDLEFADPEEEESLDDELDDDDEVISAGGAIEEEEDDLDDGASDGVATATFMAKSSDTTGLSGLLNPRRPPTGGRDGFGSRLPTPYPPPQTTIPAPSTSPFASRLGPAPAGSPYARSTTGATTAIQVPPPSGKATTETEPSFVVQKLTAQLKLPAWMFILWCGAVFILGFGVRPLFSSKGTSTPTVIVAKPTREPAAPAAAVPVVVPVQTGSAPGAAPEPAKVEPPTGKTGVEAQAPTQPIVTPTEPIPQDPNNPEAGLWRPAKKVTTPKPRK